LWAQLEALSCETDPRLDWLASEMADHALPTPVRRLNGTQAAYFSSLPTPADRYD
jgi:hypothetical protein